MAQRRSMVLLALILCLLCSLVVGLPALAQGELPQPISPTGNSIGDVVPGALTRFVVASSGNERAQFQVFAVGTGLIPRFRVLDASGTVILDVGNPAGLNTVSGTALFASPGAYIIEVSGEQNTGGQFMLSLQPGEPPPPPVELIVGQSVEGAVSAANPVLVYEFSTSDDAALTLLILSQLTQAGPTISLRDITNDRVVATSDGALLGVMHYFTAQARRYRVEVQAGNASTDVPFTICFGCAGGTMSETGSASQPGLSSTSSGACTLTTGVGGPVNVRSGPGTIYLIIGGIQVGQSFPVTGQINNASWYQIDYNGQSGWVGASVAALTGDCTSLPVLAAPPNAPLAPTPVPTATQTPLVTATSATPTATPTATSGTPGTPTSTFTPTDTQTYTPTFTPTNTVQPPATTEEA